MLLLTTFVLAGSALAASTLTGKTMRRRKSACRTWLAASQRDRDRGKRTPGSLLFDGLQKTFALLFGQTRSHQLWARRAGVGAETTSALEQTAYRELRLSLLTLVSAAVGVVLYYPLLLLTTPVVVYLWRDAFTGAYRALCKAHRVSVDVLYVCAMILAITSSYFFLLAFVAALYCGSRVLLLKTQEHVQSNVTRTFGLDQRRVWLVKAEVEVAMPLAQVAVGDVVVVHAGDPIPVDGYVTEGTAFVDQHMLTGEAQPYHASPRLTHGCITPCAWNKRCGRSLSASNPVGSVAAMKMSICWPTYNGPRRSVKR
jgi:cation transport ATPase